MSHQSDKTMNEGITNPTNKRKSLALNVQFLRENTLRFLINKGALINFSVFFDPPEPTRTTSLLNVKAWKFFL